MPCNSLLPATDDYQQNDFRMLTSHMNQSHSSLCKLMIDSRLKENHNDSVDSIESDGYLSLFFHLQTTHTMLEKSDDLIVSW